MTRKVAGIKQLCKSKRLEDLFRPPCGILFLGSFMEAREHAKSLNRWLLVNIQNPQEFSCQILNRDVWSNQQIQEIVKDHFVLWQVSISKYVYLRFIRKEKRKEQKRKEKENTFNIDAYLNRFYQIQVTVVVMCIYMMYMNTPI